MSEVIGLALVVVLAGVVLVADGGQWTVDRGQRWTRNGNVWSVWVSMRPKSTGYSTSGNGG